jgi:hypothetical protein
MQICESIYTYINTHTYLYHYTHTSVNPWNAVKMAPIVPQGHICICIYTYMYTYIYIYTLYRCEPPGMASRWRQ